jgi:hypothetical protein
MTGLKHRLGGEFVPEWCAIALLVALDIVWASQISMQFIAGFKDFALLSAGLALMAGLRALHFRRGGLIAEYFSLTLAGSTAICVLSYLCFASAGPLMDDRLMAMDRAIGFDWLAGYQLVSDWPALKAIFNFAYHSLIFQGLYFCVLLSLMDRKDRLRDMFWMFLICGLFACAGTLLFPAQGPSKLYDIATDTGFIPVMEQILRGDNLSFALSGMKGIVTFPSFHTAMALAYVWAFRGTGPIGWGIAALNAVMLCAIPFIGGHYVMDMIAGAASMLLSVGIVKGAPALWKKPSRNPQTAAANA